MHPSIALHTHRLALCTLATLPDSTRKPNRLFAAVVGARPRNRAPRLTARALLKTNDLSDHIRPYKGLSNHRNHK